MKLEKMVVATVHDQSGIYPSSFDLFQVGPVVAWTVRKAALDALLCRLTPDERELLNGVSS